MGLVTFETTGILGTVGSLSASVGNLATSEKGKD